MALYSYRAQIAVSKLSKLTRFVKGNSKLSINIKYLKFKQKRTNWATKLKIRLMLPRFRE